LRVEEGATVFEGGGPAAGQRRRARLLRVLGVTFGLAVAVGNTIGAGILSAPGEVAAQLPNVWLFFGVWVAGALYALLGANSLAELGTMMPRSGGQYVFARRALGAYAGFVVGWSDWVSTCGSAAVVSMLIGEYAGRLVPALAPHAAEAAVAVTLAFTFLQWRGIGWGSRTQNLTSLLKALAFLALVAACFALGGGAESAAGDAPRAPAAGASLLVGLTLALQAVIYTYDGWTGVIYFSEEVKDPARDIPRSLFAGVLSVAAIYLLVNAALVYVLPLARMAGETLAAGAAAEVIFGRYGDTLIRSLTVVALLSSVNALLLIATRVPFAMGRDRLFPSGAVRVNEGGTPSVALALSALVAVLFVVSGTLKEVMGVLAFFFVANYAASFTVLFVLRRREPEAPRPFRARGYPWTNALALVVSVAFLLSAVRGDTTNSLRALALLALSYPAYLLLRRFARPS
jgi:basic amino acid/polyamine antiporter, APA family